MYMDFKMITDDQNGIKKRSKHKNCSQNSEEIAAVFMPCELFNEQKKGVTGQKQHVTELKSVWPDNMTSNFLKIILSPEPLLFVKNSL